MRHGFELNVSCIEAWIIGMAKDPTRTLFGDIKSAHATDLDSGEVQELSVRSESYCHFFEPFTVSDYLVKLRLDWSDLDDMGRPSLDADFYSSKTGKKLRNSGDRRAAHKTSPSEENLRIYEWNFKTAKLRLKITIHFSVDCRDSARVSDKVIITIRTKEGKLG